MSKLTKNQKAAKAKYDSTKAYSLSEACGLLKDITYTKFDSSVEISVNLGVDPRKANQMIRGVVTLPNGTGKTVRVLVLATPDKVDEALAAGADYAEDVKLMESSMAVIRAIRNIRAEAEAAPCLSANSKSKLLC